VHAIDWLLVIVLNGAVIAYALWPQRGVRAGAHSSREWFLAGRSLPWWVVGLFRSALVRVP